MRLSTILILTLISINVFSQQNPLTSGDPFGFRKYNKSFFTSGDPFRLNKSNRGINRTDTIPARTPILAVNVGVFPLMGYFSTLQFGIEHRLTKKINLHYEWGKVVYDATSTENYDRTGFRLRFEPRYYFRNESNAVLYASTEFFYNYLEEEKASTFGINCPNGNCDYFQYANYSNIYEDAGALLKIGSLREVNIVPGLFVDMSLGFGYRIRDVYSINKPQGISYIAYDDYGDFEPNLEDYSGLHVNIGFRIGYRFK